MNLKKREYILIILTFLIGLFILVYPILDRKYKIYKFNQKMKTFEEKRDKLKKLYE